MYYVAAVRATGFIIVWRDTNNMSIEKRKARKEKYL